MPSKKRKSSKRSTQNTLHGTEGVYYVADEDYRDYKHRQLPQMTCDVCFKKAGQGGVELKKCNGCTAAWYCSEQCERQAWPEHKKSCGTVDIVESIQPHILRFLEHSGLLHFLRVALVFNLNLLMNPRSEECLRAQVALQVVPTDDDCYTKLFTRTGSTPEIMQGCLQIFRVEDNGEVDVRRSAHSLLVSMWKRARQTAAAAGRKDNPVVIVDFNYQSQDIPIGIEITREAFLTALGMPTVPSLSLPVQGLSLTGFTPESTLERINRYIQDDKEDQLGLRVQMGEYDKEFIRTLGQVMTERGFI